MAWTPDPDALRGKVAALAADPDRARWNRQSLDAGRLAREFGFTDLTRPDIWRYLFDSEAASAVNPSDYRDPSP